MLHLPSHTPEEFERNLSRFISTETSQWRRKITYIDCQNILSQYLFSREDLQPILENLYVTRIDRPYDLLDLFRSLSCNHFVEKSHYVIVSPYSHLLEGFPPQEEKNWTRMWEKSIERLESSLPVHVVVMGE
jgi:hypothetical protein